MSAPPEPYDPLALLAALERARVAYVVVGELAEVLQGSGGSADSVEIVPSRRAGNLDRLRRALDRLGVSDAAIATVSEPQLLEGRAPLALDTPAGRLVITATPAGTRGWEDLRRRAERQPLGGGVRPPVADIADLVRINEAAGGPDRSTRARTLRRMIELTHDLGPEL